MAIGSIMEPISDQRRNKHTFHFLQALALREEGAQRVGVAANEREFLSFRLEIYEKG